MGSINDLINTIQEECNCDDCEAAVSPFAYLADLIQYITGQMKKSALGKPIDEISGFTSEISLDFLQDCYCQPFQDLKDDCDELNKKICQYRIAIEVLNCHIASKTQTDCQQEIFSIEVNRFLQTAYFSLLELNGTSFTELRDTRSGLPEDRKIKKANLSEKIGIVFNAETNDTVDQLFLDPNAEESDPRQITAEKLEDLFGLRKYTRGAFDNSGLRPTCYILEWRISYLRAKWVQKDGNATYGKPIIDPDALFLEDFKLPLGCSNILQSAVTTVSGSMGSNTITVGSNAGIIPGMIVVASGIEHSAFVIQVSGVTITLSKSNSAIVSGNGTFMTVAAIWEKRRNFIDNDILIAKFRNQISSPATLSPVGVQPGNRKFVLDTTDLDNYLFPGSKLVASTLATGNEDTIVFTVRSIFNGSSEDGIEVIESIPFNDIGTSGDLSFTIRIKIDSLSATDNQIDLSQSILNGTLTSGDKIFIHGVDLNDDGEYTIDAASGTTIHVQEQLTDETVPVEAYILYKVTLSYTAINKSDAKFVIKGDADLVDQINRLKFIHTSANTYGSGVTTIVLNSPVSLPYVPEVGMVVSGNGVAVGSTVIDYNSTTFEVELSLALIAPGVLTNDELTFTDSDIIVVESGVNDGHFNLESIPASISTNNADLIEILIDLSFDSTSDTAHKNYILSGNEDGKILFPVDYHVEYLIGDDQIRINSNLLDVLLLNQSIEIRDESNNAVLLTTTVKQLIPGSYTTITTNEELSTITASNLKIRFTREIAIKGQTPRAENIFNTLIEDFTYSGFSDHILTPWSDVNWAIYGDISANNWAPLSQIKSDLLTGLNTNIISQNLWEKQKLKKAEFIRLVEIYEKYLNHEENYKNDNVTTEEWGDFYNILISSIKRAFSVVWIEEEINSSINFSYNFFQLNNSFSKVGELPPTFSSRIPIVDPEKSTLSDIISNRTGLNGLTLFNSRRDQLMRLKANFYRKYELGGFSSALYMAFNTLIDFDQVDETLLEIQQNVDLGSSDPAHKAAILKLNDEFLISLDEFNKIIEIKGKADLRNVITPEELNSVFNLFVRVIKEKRLYPAWIYEELSTPYNYRTEDNKEWDKYYRAIKTKIPAWRVSGEDRRNWQNFLQQFNRLPIVDPDALKATDFSDLANTAADLWETRRLEVKSKYDDYLEIVNSTNSMLFPHEEQKVMAIVSDAIDAPFSEFNNILSNEASGFDVRQQLIQLNLSSPAYRRLSELYRITVDHSTNLITKEWLDIVNISIQIWKQRAKYLIWNSEETDEEIALSPDFFRIPVLKPELSLVSYNYDFIEWRATIKNRKIWERTLKARLREFQSLSDNFVNQIKAVEENSLPILRNALVQAAGEDHISLEENAQSLSDRLLIDFKINCCQYTTRTSQAIDTLQKFIWQESIGTAKNVPVYDTNNDIDYFLSFNITDLHFEGKWKWFGSYATWRAAMFVFLYPENLLLPQLKREQSYGFRSMITEVSAKTRFIPSMACEAAQKYSDYYKDICNLDIQATCNAITTPRNDVCNTTSFQDKKCSFHQFAKSSHSNKIYWNHFQKGPLQGGGLGIDAIHNFWIPLEPFGVDTIKILGAVPYRINNGNKYIYVFGLRKDKDKAELKVCYLRFDLDSSNWEDELKDLDLPVGVDSSNIIIKQKYDYDSPPLFIYLNGNKAFYNYLDSKTGSSWENSSNWLSISTSHKIGGNSQFITGIWSQINQAEIQSLLCACSTSSDDFLDYVLVARSNHYEGDNNDSIVEYLHIAHIKQGIVKNNLISFKNVTKQVTVKKTIHSNLNRHQIRYYPANYRGRGYERQPEPYDNDNYEDIASTTTIDVSVNLVRDELRNTDFIGMVNLLNDNQVQLFTRDNNGYHQFAVNLNSNSDVDVTKKGKLSAERHHPWNSSIDHIIHNCHSLEIQSPAEVLYCFSSNSANNFVFKHSAFFTYSEVGFDYPLLFVGDGRIVAPITEGPFDISENMSSNQLVLKREVIKEVFSLNTENYATNQILEYLREAYYFVPLYLGMQLLNRGYYHDALKWFKTLYDYTQDDGDSRVIYDGLDLDARNANPAYARNNDWLLDPLNPHGIARTRSNAYFRFTIATIARCLIEYANNLFTLDTIETVSRAKELYELANELLSLEELQSLPEICRVDFVSQMLTTIKEETLCAIPSAEIKVFGDLVEDLFASVLNDFGGAHISVQANALSEIILDGVGISGFNLRTNLIEGNAYLLDEIANLPDSLSMSDTLDKMANNGLEMEQAFISSGDNEIILLRSTETVIAQFDDAMVKITGLTPKNMVTTNLSWLQESGS